MKSNYFVQCFGNEINFSELKNKAKEEWREKGHKIKDIKTLDVYYKPEENKCYYVFNEEISGSFIVE